MHPQVGYLTVFTAAVAARQPHGAGHAVRSAYGAGVSRDDLLAALHIARELAEVPASAVAAAYATIQAGPHPVPPAHIAPTRSPGSIPGRMFRRLARFAHALSSLL